MAIGPSIYLGKTGASGGVRGPHGHFEVIKDGKRYGLSQTRADIGQKIQFRLPGSEIWQQMYSQGVGGRFQLNPAIALTEGMGTRAVHPVTGAKNVAHQGEDYSFPTGTDLRFMGGGKVQGLANVGRAGNISTLHTGPYKLDVFHMSKLPETASALESTTAPEDPQLPGSTTQASNEDSVNKLLEALGIGKQPTLKDMLVSQALNQALQRKQEMSSFASLPQAGYISPQQAMEMFS